MNINERFISVSVVLKLNGDGYLCSVLWHLNSDLFTLRFANKG